MHDTLNFLSKLNARKTGNALKVWSSYHASRWLKQPFHRGMPITVSIEPTTSCNLRCPQCPSGLRSFSRETGMLDEKFFRKTVDEIHADLLYLYFYFQGEPYLHPQFLDLVRYAAEKNIYTVTSTNAHFLDDENARKTVESGLDRIIISLDGATQETYQTYRVGGKLEKVLQGAENLMKWKRQLRSKTPHVVLQFLVMKQNENEISAIYRIAEKIGVDEVKLKSAQIYDFENGSDLLPVAEKFSRYELVENSFYQIKNKLLNHCWKMWHSCVITWDGFVVPCCFDKDAQHRFGNLQKKSFHEIWNSNPYNEFRKQILISRKEIDICTNCSEGTKVWVG